MGKKSLISKRYAAKLEIAAIVLLSFILYFCLKTDEAPKEEEQQKAAEEEVVGRSEGQETEDVSETEENVSVYFDSDIAMMLKKMISSAQKSISVSTYTYAKNELTDLLEKKHKEGIKVRVAAGKNKDRTIPPYDFSVLETANGIYHAKFLVFDEKDVVILSSNIASDRSAANNAVLFRNVPQAAGILEAEITDLMAGRISGQRCRTGCETEIGTIIFNPGSGCRMIKEEIIKAEKSVKAGIYTLTQKNPVMTGIKNAAKKGIRIDMVVDNWQGNDGKVVNKKAFDYLSSLGVSLKYDEAGRDSRVFHHKFAEIDGKTAILGSMNWTASGCYKNREIIVISRNGDIAAAFADYVDSFR